MPLAPAAGARQQGLLTPARASRRRLAYAPDTPPPPPCLCHCSTWSLCLMAVSLLQEQQKAKLGVGNAGHLLLGFLKYFGRVFDLEVSN